MDIIFILTIALISVLGFQILNNLINICDSLTALFCFRIQQKMQNVQTEECNLPNPIGFVVTEESEEEIDNDTIL